METHNIVACCGAKLITHFGGNIGVNYDNKAEYTSEQVRKYLSDIEAANRIANNPLLIAILNNSQNVKFATVFAELGWELKSEAYHPKHYSKLYLYVKHIVFLKPDYPYQSK